MTELKGLAGGHAGEVEFDHILEEGFSDMDFIHMKDFCFKTGRNGSLTKVQSSVDQEIQIDNIIIAADRMITFEVKNYNFDLVYGEGQWTYTNGRKFGDPLLQVGRQKVALQEFLDKAGFSVSLFSTVVFINPEQTIFNLPDRPEIIVRSNMMKKLRKVIYPNRNDHSNLVGRLEAGRLFESQYQGDVGVLFEDLKAGVFCRDCGERAARHNQQRFRCPSCDSTWTLLEVIKRLIYEIKTLNRTWEITPTIINRFSGGEISESCVRRHRKKSHISF